MLLPPRTRRQAPATFTVRVGSADDFYFDPPQVTAAVGDTIRFTFPPGANHAVVQSRPDAVCVPLDGGWTSPHFDLRKWGGAAHTFDVNVTSTEPVFFYCPLPGLPTTVYHGNQNAKAHCINGMLGALNAPETAYEAYARSAVGLADLPPQPSLTLVAPTGTPNASAAGSKDDGDVQLNTKQIVGLVVAAIALVFIIVGVAFLHRRRAKHAHALNRPPPIAARAALRTLRRNSQPLGEGGGEEALPAYERRRNPDAVPAPPAVRAYEMSVLPPEPDPDASQPPAPVGHALFGMGMGRAPTYVPIVEDETGRTHARSTSLGVGVGVPVDAPPRYEEGR